MSFETKRIIVTSDGKEHASADAAREHVRALNYGVLGNATSRDFEAAVSPPTDKPMDEHIFKVREAVRDVFLVMWPRASKGKSRPPKADDPPNSKSAPGTESTGETASAGVEAGQGEEAPEPTTEAETEPTKEPEPAPRSGKKRGH